MAQIRFTEWTADAKLRHPVYLGLRDDKDPREVVREQKARRTARSERRAHEVSGSRTPRSVRL